MDTKTNDVCNLSNNSFEAYVYSWTGALIFTFIPSLVNFSTYYLMNLKQAQMYTKITTKDNQIELCYGTVASKGQVLLKTCNICNLMKMGDKSRNVKLESRMSRRLMPFFKISMTIHVVVFSVVTRVVMWYDTNVSDGLTASIFIVMKTPKSHVL
jgi:hypothetical protein